MGSITKKMFCQVEKMCNEIDDDINDDINDDIKNLDDINDDDIKNLDDTNDDIIMMTSKILMTRMMTS